jgi:hypothetical protein
LARERWLLDPSSKTGLAAAVGVDQPVYPGGYCGGIWVAFGHIESVAPGLFLENLSPLAANQKYPLIGVGKFQVLQKRFA